MAPSGGQWLLLALCVTVVWSEECPPNTIPDLTCVTDYDRSVSCEWSSEHREDCFITAHRVNIKKRSYFIPDSAECVLQPRDSRGRRTCELLFKNTFKTFYVHLLNLSCANSAVSLTTQYKALCHIKLEAPGKPVINRSSVSWGPLNRTLSLNLLKYQLQWRLQHQPWSNDRKKNTSYRRAELPDDSLLLHHTYLARVRVGVVIDNIESTWSDWSPTASWESAVGRTEDTSEPDSGGAWLWTVIAAVASVSTVMFLCGLYRTDRGRWVYVMKTMKGPPLPHPADSILKKHTWMGPYSSASSYLSFFPPVEIIASVEVTGDLHHIDHLDHRDHRMDNNLTDHRDHRDQRDHSDHSDHSLSSFSNPSYSHLCPPAVPEPSGQSTDRPPQGAVEQHMGPVFDLSMFLSLVQQSQGVVICEYEKVGAGQGPCPDEQGTGLEEEREGPEERVRLLSVDSGVGSGEEPSQDSLLPEEAPDPRPDPKIPELKIPEPKTLFLKYEENQNLECGTMA